MPTDKYMAKAQHYHDALKRIAAYMPPDKLRSKAGKLYGLEGDEAIEMAYDNVLGEARRALLMVRMPAPKKPVPIPAKDTP